MNVFIVDLKHQPGELAKAAESIARKGVNITAFAGITCGGSGEVAFLTDDDVQARHLFSEGGYKVRELDVVPVTFQNSPGSLAKTARKLADAGISIEAALPISMTPDKVTLAFATDQPSKARGVLGITEPVGASYR
jgi:hypothetical protein